MAFIRACTQCQLLLDESDLNEKCLCWRCQEKKEEKKEMPVKIYKLPLGRYQSIQNDPELIKKIKRTEKGEINENLFLFFTLGFFGFVFLSFLFFLWVIFS